MLGRAHRQVNVGAGYYTGTQTLRHLALRSFSPNALTLMDIGDFDFNLRIARFYAVSIVLRLGQIYGETIRSARGFSPS